MIRQDMYVYRNMIKVGDIRWFLLLMASNNGPWGGVYIRFGMARWKKGLYHIEAMVLCNRVAAFQLLHFSKLGFFVNANDVCRVSLP